MRHGRCCRALLSSLLLKYFLRHFRDAFFLLSRNNFLRLFEPQCPLSAILMHLSTSSRTKTTGTKLVRCVTRFFCVSLFFPINLCRSFSLLFLTGVAGFPPSARPNASARHPRPRALLRLESCRQVKPSSLPVSVRKIFSRKTFEGACFPPGDSSNTSPPLLTYDFASRKAASSRCFSAASLLCLFTGAHRILNRFTKDIHFMDDLLPEDMYDFIVCSFMVVGGTLIIFVVNPWVVLR